MVSESDVTKESSITPYVLFTCFAAANGGLVYGYDLSIAGGVGIMDDFLQKFYPSVLRSKQSAKTDNYCKYNDQLFQLFTSSLYASALIATFCAFIVTRKFGKKTSMLVAGLLFLAGSAFAGGAQNLAMLIAGRALLGCGLGFSNQAIPLYLSEIAPPGLRGGLSMLFSINTVIGVFAGNVVNFFASTIHPWGWRLSLGFSGVPAVLITLSSLILVETPMSLIQRGQHEKAKQVLRKIRRSNQVEAEFDDLVEASEIADREKIRFRTLFSRRNRPQLVVGAAFPFFQQVSGNDAILFYGTFLFKAAGFKDHVALYSAVIIGGLSLCGCLVGIYVVDRAGRRVLLLTGSVVMSLTMAVIGIIFATGLRTGSSGQYLSPRNAYTELGMVCAFVFAFLFSLGPLAWLIPSEIFPEEIRSAGQSVVVFVNMLFKFTIAQTFLSMLCAFKFGAFLFFGGWALLTGIFVLFLLPETKGIPLHKMRQVWRKHWFWKRFCVEEGTSLPEILHSPIPSDHTT